MKKIHVTVTTAPGQPTIDLEGDLSTGDIAVVVKQRFGKNAPPGAAVAMPHSFCATIDPAPAPAPASPSASSLGGNGPSNFFNPGGSRRWAC